jgi:hypothetical protein
MWNSLDQEYMLSQVCRRIEQYANYGVPVASELVSPKAGGKMWWLNLLVLLPFSHRMERLDGHLR